MSFDPNSPNTQTLQPTGVLDRVSGERLQQEVKALVASGITTVVLDCSQVDLIDSSGLGALVVCFKTLRAVDGQLYLSHLNEQAQMLLTLTGMDDVFVVL